jgi:hypothetical protein
MNGHMEAAVEPGKDVSDDKSEKYSISCCPVWQNQCLTLHIAVACDMYHR